MGIRSGEHIKLRGGVYHYRRVVPSDCRKAFGLWELTRSLGTSSKSEAKRLEKEIDIEFEARVSAIRAARDPHEVARQISANITMPVVAHARGGFGVTARLAELPSAEQKVATEVVQSYRAALATQHSAVSGMVRELDAIFAKPVALEVLSRFRSATVSLARSMVEGAASPAVPDPGAHTLPWCFERWSKGGATKGSKKQAGRHWNSFLAHSELVLLSDVRRRHLVDWKDTLVDSGEFAPESINQRLALVMAILRTGWREAEMLAPDLRKIKVPVGESNRQRWSRDEIMLDLSVLKPNTWQAWLFVIGLTTGVRLGEPVAALRSWWKPEIGFIDIPRRFTKKRKLHAIPILPWLREPLTAWAGKQPANGYLFNCPRPEDSEEPISNFASRTFNRFMHDKGIERVFHELRDTWIEEAVHCPDVKKEIWEIISGHSAATVSDGYGGEKPEVLLNANEKVCRFVSKDTEMQLAIIQLLT